jgi:L,D-peptidoglycan transpeptidase YkuD (ErfK/YbiS/YcfS/YnhG family)
MGLCVLTLFTFASSVSVSGANRTTTARPLQASRQLIIGLTESWSSSRATLYRFDRTSKGWSRVGKEIAARLGPKGLAWGAGLVDRSEIPSPIPEEVPEKAEGDQLAPAGVFSLGPVYSYDAGWKKKTKMSFVQVGPNDLFVEDPKSPLYNTHVRLDHAPRTAWEKNQQMEQGDAAHRLKVFVGHNVNPPVPGKGSAIWLHIWRDNGAKVTAGCTSLNAASLAEIVRWLDPDAQPTYILLPATLYSEIADPWQLPLIAPQK